MSSTATAKPQRQLRSDAAGVFVPMTPLRLSRVDDYRQRLSLSRGGAVAALIDAFGDDALQSHLAAREADAAAAESIQPLSNAALALADAWQQRARQRQSIGVHTNQLARYANALAAAIRDGQQVLPADVVRLVDATKASAATLDEQLSAELEDQLLVKQLRDLVTEWVVRS